MGHHATMMGYAWNRTANTGSRGSGHYAAGTLVAGLACTTEYLNLWHGLDTPF